MNAADAKREPLATGSVIKDPDSGWLSGLTIYRRPRLIAILLMGFSSGLPLALTFGTLSYWLAEIGVSLTAIGLFGLVRTSYSLKFLWAPLIDRLPIPFLTARLGRRRSWALVIQLALVLAILALGLTDPRVDPAATALAAVVVAFLSASQDIVIDAYRIELLLPEEQGAGAAATQWGYRFGMLAAGAGALYAANFGGWSFAYALMAALMAVGMVTVLLTPEPGGIQLLEPLPGDTALARIGAWLEGAVVNPFTDVIVRRGAALIVIFVVLFKFGDALAGSMSNPLYVALGFTKVEVATIAKVYGVVATLAGVALGGLLVARFGLYWSLFVCGGLQALSNLMYVLQVWAGHDVGMLAFTIGGENLTGGMASAAFVAYLSGLCSRDFTATQYALLSALATVGLNVLAASGGYLAERLGWTPFFLLSTALCVPSLALLLWISRLEQRDTVVSIYLGDRLGRLKYFWRSLLTSGITTACTTFAVAAGLGLVAPVIAIVGGGLQIWWVVRRLHDIGASGWTCLLVFVPLMNFILLFVLFFAKSAASQGTAQQDGQTQPSDTQP